ncbi:MAG: alpha/beta hydrolase fold domain-containing protein [Clostridia bacterium]|nr:alpha/beta hydrolase fold domain-containing protein [Clostridia bacterium]
MKNILRSQLTLLKPFLASCSLSTVRRGQETIGKLMAAPNRGDVSYDDFKIGDMPCSMITPADEVSPGVILYLHGGGFVAGGLTYAKGFGSALAAKCGIRVLCVGYRLAPEHIFPAALDDAMDAYGYLLTSGFAPAEILLCGESAGGGLCYSLCEKLKDKGRTLPAGIIAISPWTDLTASGASYEENKKNDPSMTAERLKYFADCYLYGADPAQKGLHPKTNPNAEDDRQKKSDPLISPLFASLDGMPPSVIFVGGDEIMLNDATEMHERLLAAGAESSLTVKEGMWHGYILYGLKENEADFDTIRRFIRACIPHQRKLRWMTLDNAAKIFPAARSRHWSNMFRLSATLGETVDTAILQSALDVTVRRFPSIAVRLRRGVFWYYLEEIPAAPAVMEEKPYPLSRMLRDDIRKCAFRVTVYDRRIAVEFFHALTDGNGGLVFLKTLVSEYIYQRYGVKVPTEGGILDRLEEPSPEEMEDSFFKHAGPHAASRKDTDAFRIAGKREADGYRTNTTLILDAEQVRAEAKKYGVTVTAYLTAVLIEATASVQRERVRDPKRYKPVKVLIPVNLRKLFPSRTLRNFVLYATPGIDMRLGDYTFAEIVSIVHHAMQLQITEKNMAAMIATNVGSERPFILRACPLFIKNFVMKLIFRAVGERKSCFSFSNLGVANVPPEFSRFVERLDFVLGAQETSPYNTSLITYNGRMYLNIIRNMREPVLEPAVYRSLRARGLHVTAESNTRGEDG